MRAWLRVLFIVWIACMGGFVANLFAAPLVRADDAPALPPIVPVLLAATQDLTHLQGAPEFVMMTTEQMKADGCADVSKCPTLVSVHPPRANYIIVNSDIDLAHDLNAQGQLVHVIAMFLIEQAGRYSPDMPCNLVMQIEAFADQVQMAYLDVMAQEYVRVGKSVPPLVKPQVWTFCTPPGAVVKGEI
jgi:hypothetical protein